MQGRRGQKGAARNAARFLPGALSAPSGASRPELPELRDRLGHVVAHRRVDVGPALELEDSAWAGVVVTFERRHRGARREDVLRPDDRRQRER